MQLTLSRPCMRVLEIIKSLSFSVGVCTTMLTERISQQVQGVLLHLVQGDPHTS